MGGAESVDQSSSAARMLRGTISSEDPFWDTLLSYDLQVQNLAEHIPPESVCELKQIGMSNILTLLRKCIMSMKSAADIGSTTCAIPSTTLKSLTSALALVTTIMPGLHEPQSPEIDEEMDRVFWGSSLDASSVGSTLYTSIAYELLSVLMRLLFLKNFSVQFKGVLQPNERLLYQCVDQRMIWRGGIACPTDVADENPVTVGMLKNRALVLRCLLLCLCEPVYRPVDHFHSSLPKWLCSFIAGELPYTATLFSSLTALVFTHTPGSFMSTSTADELAALSAQLLCVTIDVIPSLFEVEDENNTKVRNVFRLMLGSIHRDNEFQLLFSGIVELLETHPKSLTWTMANKPVGHYKELLLLLWHLLTLNSKFCQKVVNSNECNNLVKCLLYFMLEGNENQNDVTIGPSKTGVMQICAFILLLLSSKRSFSIQLNAKYDGNFVLSDRIPKFSDGCFADMFILCLHRVIADAANGSASDSLIDLLLTVLCNISAYVKSISFEASVKILHLLERFSRPAWIYKSQFRYHDVFFLLDTLNNLIQYQFEGNLKLIYCILREPEMFLKFEKLQFDSVAAEKARTIKNNDDTPQLDVRKNIVGGRSESTQTMNLHSFSKENSDVNTNDASDVNDNGKANSERRNSHGSRDASDAAWDDDGEWVATQEWFADWKAQAPTETISRLLQCLLPMVEAECRNNGVTEQDEVLTFLADTTMVGLLPVPHPIIIRNYQPNALTTMWLSSYTWGIVFSHHQNLNIFTHDSIKLFYINQ